MNLQSSKNSGDDAQNPAPAARRPLLRWIGLLIVAVPMAGAGFAAESAVAATDKPGRASPAPPARQFVVRHQGVFNGTVVHYTSTAGETLIETEDLTPIGYVFSFAYTKDDIPDTGTRPVLFIFNGGPGSSSFWLHAGALGPKRAAIPEDANKAAEAPFRFVDNNFSPLDLADLVFIDPVGTGYSRMLKDGRPEQFYGTDADASVMTEFIRRWLSEHNRWNSPKLLVGESYGATRAALTAKKLIGGVSTNRFPAISLNGIVLLGASLDSGPGDSDAEIGAALTGMAAAAWYHGKVDKDGRTLEGFLTQARLFAVHDYLPALFEGNSLDAGERNRIVAKLHDFLGLSPAFIVRKNLRIDIRSFAGELLADQGLALSIYDARYSFGSTAGETDAVGDDPSMTRVGPAIVAGLLSYIRQDLGVRIDSRYEPISWAGSTQWKQLPENYDLARDLGRAMRQNPQLRLMIASGYYDLITSAGGVQYSLTHGEVPPERVQWNRYESGHMPYIGEENVRKFNADLHQFIATVTRP